MRLRKTMLTIQFKKGNGQVMKPPMNAKTVMSHFVLSPVFAMFVVLPVPLNLDIKCFAVNLSNC
jgi:hypothetical protein